MALIVWACTTRKEGLTFKPGSLRSRAGCRHLSERGQQRPDSQPGSGAWRRFSKVLSYGNATDLDESDLLDYLAEDPETEIVAAYMEGVKDGRRFSMCCVARRVRSL